MEQEGDYMIEDSVIWIGIALLAVFLLIFFIVLFKIAGA